MNEEVFSFERSFSILAYQFLPSESMHHYPWRAERGKTPLHPQEYMPVQALGQSLARPKKRLWGRVNSGGELPQHSKTSTAMCCFQFHLCLREGGALPANMDHVLIQSPSLQAKGHENLQDQLQVTSSHLATETCCLLSRKPYCPSKFSTRRTSTAFFTGRTSSSK